MRLLTEAEIRWVASEHPEPVVDRKRRPETEALGAAPTSRRSRAFWVQCDRNDEGRQK